MPLPDPISLGLPAKPGSLPTAEAGPSRPPAAATPTSSLASTAPSTSSTTTCGQCTNEAKYTCPRCSARTCSLPCSKAHKASTGCSGVRDPAAFVPLNKITQGTWDGDYAWLEGTRRQVAQFGEGITADEAAGEGVVVSGSGGAGASRGGRGGAARGGRGGGSQRPPARKSKLDGLKWAIAEIGAEVDVLPDGMQRRKTNQSSWNPKTRALFLTVQLVVQPTLGDEPLLSHPRCPVLPAEKSVSLASLLPDSLSDADIVFALPYHMPRRHSRDVRNASAPDLAGAPALVPGARRFFPPLDGTTPLEKALTGTAWVEFPTVHLYARAEWDAAVAAGEVVVVQKHAPADNKRKADADADAVAAVAEAEDAGEAGEDVKAVGADADEHGPSKKARTDTATATTAATAALDGHGLVGLGAYGDSDEESDDDGDEAADEAVGGDEDADEHGGDITLAPEMAAALGAALVADFGVQEER